LTNPSARSDDERTPGVNLKQTRRIENKPQSVLQTHDPSRSDNEPSPNQTHTDTQTHLIVPLFLIIRFFLRCWTLYVRVVSYQIREKLEYSPSRLKTMKRMWLPPPIKGTMLCICIKISRGHQTMNAEKIPILSTFDGEPVTRLLCNLTRKTGIQDCKERGRRESR
jgi:hypothetical protein